MNKTFISDLHQWYNMERMEVRKMKGKIVENIPEFGYADVALLEDQIFAEKARIKGKREGLKILEVPEDEIDVILQPDRENVKRLNRIKVRMRVQIEKMGFENAGERPKTPEEHFQELKEELAPQLEKMLETIEKCPENARGMGMVETYNFNKLYTTVKQMNFNLKTGFGEGL